MSDQPKIPVQASRSNGMTDATALANSHSENFSRGRITEGIEVRGGVGSIPSTPKPPISMVAQKPAAPVASVQAPTSGGAKSK
jgi:hypothetical protein